MTQVCIDGLEFEQVLGAGDGQGSLAMDRGAWHAAVHGVTKSWTRMSGRTEL